MWNKLAHFVKRNLENEPNNGDEQNRHNDKDASGVSATTNSSVMSRVYDQHPNLSHFHSGSAIHLPSPSPPESPSKGSKRSLFKRSLKAKFTSTPVSQTAQGEVSSPASPWSSLNLAPKKVRASLHIDTFTAQSSIVDPAPHSAPLPLQLQTSTIAEQHPDTVYNPLVEVQPAGTGSIRSILRDRNTPGTGQSVRFFSRDAYRVISPDVSGLEIDQDIPHIDSEAFLEKLKLVSPERSSVQTASTLAKHNFQPTTFPDHLVDMSSPPRNDSSPKSRKPLPFQPRHPSRTRNSSGGSSHSRSASSSSSGSNSQSLSSLTIPIPPEDMPSLFNISQEHELAEIPVSAEGGLCDNAIEVEDENELDNKEKVSDNIGETSLRTIRRCSQLISSSTSTSTPNHDKSAPPPRTIHSPDGTVFHSMMPLTPPTEAPTLFHSFSNTTNERTSATTFFTPNVSQAKIANGTVFYTPKSTDSSSSTLSEANALVLARRQATSTLSSETSEGLIVHSQEELVASLREQLAIQQQLTFQFEVDLSARDELVSMLTTQLQNSEASAEKYRKEVERRQNAMRMLRDKVSELENICRTLEDEVERSREESFERSVMDEASEGAMVVLHSSIGQLKGDLGKAKEDEAKLRQECDMLSDEARKFVDEKQRLEEVERELKDIVESKVNEIKVLEDKVEEASLASSQAQQAIDSLQAEVVEKQQVIDDERERHNLTESQWLDEKNGLMTRLDARMSEQGARTADLELLRRTLDEREEEVKALKAEVEAQWDHAEKADGTITRLEGEKEGLTKSVQTLHTKVEELGIQWKDSEAKKVELEEELNEAWAAKDEIEQERDHLVEDVNFEREHAEQLAHTLQESSSKLQELEQERSYAVDNVFRLEELLRKRDVEIEDAQLRIVDREQEAEDLRAQMSKMQREHNRAADEQGRHLDEIAQREKAARTEVEDAVRQKAEDAVELSSVKGRVATLSDDVDRLRRQVHDLKQESADKEVKLLQLNKARAQDKEDKEGLNIALDSKQQELELLKRKMGVKGTAGSTPAPSRVGLSDLTSRRRSLAFVTPSAPRPRPGSLTGVTRPSTTDAPLQRPLSSSNGVRASTSTVQPSRLGMGPPPAHRGTSLSASTSSLSRATSSKPRSSLLASHRRSVSVMSSDASYVTGSDKENDAPVETSKSSLIPA